MQERVLKQVQRNLRLDEEKTKIENRICNHAKSHYAMPHSVTYCNYTGSTVRNYSLLNNVRLKNAVFDSMCRHQT